MLARVHRLRIWRPMLSVAADGCARRLLSARGPSETLRETAALWRLASPLLRARLLPRAGRRTASVDDNPKSAEKGVTSGKGSFVESRVGSFVPDNTTPAEKDVKHAKSSFAVGPRHTLGSAAVQDVAYFTGPHAQRWGELFHRQAAVARTRDLAFSSSQSEGAGKMGGALPGHELGWESLAPAYRCPLCVSKILSRRNRHRPRRSKALWMSPEGLTNHLSWCHPHEGYTPQEFAAFNAYIVECIVARQAALVAQPHSTEESDCARMGALPPPPPSSSVPFGLILLVDVANLELNCSPAVLELLQSPEAERFFSTVSVAFCMIHEIFIPHTAKTPHGFFQLAQRHPSSDFFTYYAVSRLESGDMGIASLITALRLSMEGRVLRQQQMSNVRVSKPANVEERPNDAAPPRLPPMVLLTMDKHLKASLTSHYGDGGGDAKIFSTLVDASEYKSMNGATSQLLGKTEAKLYVPRAISAFQILRTLNLLQGFNL